MDSEGKSINSHHCDVWYVPAPAPLDVIAIEFPVCGPHGLGLVSASDSQTSRRQGNHAASSLVNMVTPT